MTAAVEVTGLVKEYGGVRALDGIDLTVPAGTVMGVLGPNGAGKTTLVRILTTLLRPTAGMARVSGIDVIRSPMEVRRVIGLSGQYAAVDENLTGFENLRMVARLYGMSSRRASARASELLAEFGLEVAANARAGTYSGGMRRRLDLAGALIARPPVVMLDEPTTGLDPRARLDMWRVIEELVADGTTVLLTTQYLEEADRLADAITVFDRGRIIASGSAEELKATVGGEQLTVTLAVSADAPMAMTVLNRVGAADPYRDGDSREVSVVVGDGSKSMVAALRMLADARVHVTDATLHKPSLEEVFLELTGKTIGQESATASDTVSATVGERWAS